MSNLSSWQLLHLMTNFVSVSFLKLLTKITSRKPTSSFMLRSFSDETKIQNLYSFSHTVAFCIPVRKVNVKISWRKINYIALPIRLLSVEADVYKTCLFLFEIVFLMYEIQKKKQNNYKHCGSQNNRHVKIYNPFRSLLQIQWRKWTRGHFAHSIVYVHGRWIRLYEL